MEEKYTQSVLDIFITLGYHDDNDYAYDSNMSMNSNESEANEPLIMDAFRITKTLDDIKKLDHRASQYLTYKVGQAINTYFSPIVFPIGFFGNLLVLVALLRHPRMQPSFFVYLVALAVTDSLVLTVAMYVWAVTVLTRGLGMCCPLIGFLFSTVSSLRISLIFLITLDRYLATCYPFRSFTWRTRRRALQVTSSVIVFCCAIGIPNAFTSKQVNSFTCAGFMQNTLLSVVACMTNVVFFGALPLIAVLVLNFEISRSAKVTHRKFANLLRANAKAAGQDSSPGSSPNASRLSTPNKQAMVKKTKSTHGIDLKNAPCKAKCTKHKMEYVPFSMSTVAAIWILPLDVVQAPPKPDISRSRCAVLAHLSNSRTPSSTSLSSTSSASSTTSSSTSSMSSSTHRVAADRQMTRVLIGITVTLYICVLPSLVRYVVFVFVEVGCPASLAMYVLFFNISHKLCIANSMVNVLMYSLSGAKFRREFIEFLRLKRVIGFYQRLRRTQ